MRWIRLLLSAVAAAFAMLAAVLAAGRATERRKHAAREAELRKAVEDGTAAAKWHKEVQRIHEDDARKAERAAREKIKSIARKDKTLEQIMNDFNAGRDS